MIKLSSGTNTQLIIINIYLKLLNYHVESIIYFE